MGYAVTNRYAVFSIGARMAKEFAVPPSLQDDLGKVKARRAEIATVARMRRLEKKVALMGVRLSQFYEVLRGRRIIK